MPEVKTCSKCNETKPLADFHYHSTAKFNRRPECADCRNAASSAWAKNNPEKQAARVARYRLSNPAYREKEREYQRQYTQSHPDVVSFHNKRRRARRLAATDGSLTREVWSDILTDFDHSCAYCGSTELISMDHVVPLSRGGKHSADNVVPACMSCNASKGTKLPIEFQYAILKKGYSNR